MARTKGSKNRPKTQKKAASPIPQTAQSLQDLQDAQKLKHLKSENTTGKYAQYVAAGRKWLMQFEEGENNWGANVSEGTSLPACPDSTDFLRAFDDKPNEHSPRALSLFLTHKIFQQNRGIGTADGIFSAFKGLWKHSSGDKYRGDWRFNQVTKEWEGNPADAAEVSDLCKAIKNKCGEQGGDRKHSVAMSKEYMDKIFTWSLSQFPENAGPSVDGDKAEAIHIKHVMFRAFMSLAWTIWTRNFELIKLQRKHLVLNLVDTYGDDYFDVHLVDRKGWQKRVDKQKTEEDLRSNRYKIYSQPLTPACDAQHWVLRWLSYLEQHVYHRALSEDDYIFPPISSNGSVQVGEHISHDTVQKWITEFIISAEVPMPPGGNFTTHCFRRGGAQYRFMFAPNGEKWSLKMIRWWGGWAEGEHTNTLIKYLLDELSSYENDYSDALCPNRKRETDESSALDAAPRAVTKEHLDSVVSAKLQKELAEIKLLLSSSFRPPLGSSAGYPAAPSLDIVTPHVSQPFTSLQNSTFARPSPSTATHRSTYPPIAAQLVEPRITISLSTSSSLTSSSPSCSTSSSPEPSITAPAPIIPDVPVRLPDGRMSKKSNSWKEIVDHWQYPDPARGLTTAMKDWPREWFRVKEYRGKVATQYHYRKTIATEFLHQYNGNEAAFLSAYPEALSGQTALRKAIEKRREERGDLVRRGPRRKA